MGQINQIVKKRQTQSVLDNDYHGPWNFYLALSTEKGMWSYGRDKRCVCTYYVIVALLYWHWWNPCNTLSLTGLFIIIVICGCCIGWHYTLTVVLPVLYWTVLYCTVLYCTVLCCTVLYSLTHLRKYNSFWDEILMQNSIHRWGGLYFLTSHPTNTSYYSYSVLMAFYSYSVPIRVLDRFIFWWKCT